MVKLQLTLWSCTIISGVLSLNQAVPYELLYFYDVYKMEYASVPAGARTIAVGCQHTVNRSPAGNAFEAEAIAAGVQGICTFDEFVKYVGATNGFGKAWKFTNDGRTLTPDPDKILEKVWQRNNVFKAPFLYWASQLLPKAGFPSSTGAGATSGHIYQTPFPEILQPILDACQTSRNAAAQVGGNVATLVNSWLEDAKKHLRIANQFRLWSQSKYLVPFIENSAQAKPFTLVKDKVQILNFDGQTPFKEWDWKGAKKSQNVLTYERINVEATFAAAGIHVTDAQKTALTAVLANYGRSTTDLNAKVHQDVIDMNKFAGNIMHGNDLSCRQKRRSTVMPKQRSVHISEI